MFIYLSIITNTNTAATIIYLFMNIFIISFVEYSYTLISFVEYYLFVYESIYNKPSARA